MSMNSADPSTLFGGTWEVIENSFLFGAGTWYAAGDTGGEASHTLTVSEMPSHAHNFEGHEGMDTCDQLMTPGSNYPNRGAVYRGGRWGGSGNGFITIQNTGGGTAHNNMPPYLVVYMWKRTA